MGMGWYFSGMGIGETKYTNKAYIVLFLYFNF